MSAEEIAKIKQERENEMKMIEQKEREKAAAEGKEVDPLGKYNGDNPNAKKPTLEGTGITPGKPGGQGGTGSGSGGSGRGGGSGSGGGTNSTKKPSGANATKKK